MCAWLRTTASICFGSKGNFRLRSIDSSRLPWNSPHSSKRRWPLISNRYIDPVVVRVAPRKRIFIGATEWEGELQSPERIFSTSFDFHCSYGSNSKPSQKYG